MKIIFIRPNMFDMRSTDAMQPLVFSILAGLTPSDIEIVFYDERLEPIPFDEDTDLVAMTVETYTARRAYEISSRYRERGIPIVMGGYHPTFLPQEALQYADAVVIGDAEGVWKQIVKDVHKGTLQKIYQLKKPSELNNLKYDRSIFGGKKYVNINPVQYSRGCRFACDFCSIHAFYGSNLRQRPVQDVVEEIRTLDSRHIFIVDDNIFIDIPKAEELFRALIPLNIRWSCQVSIDVANNPGLLKLMEKSGCTVAIIGFESLDERNLIQMKKKWNIKHGKYASAIKKFQDHGIMIYGTFIIGYDYDDKDTFDRNIDFALSSNFCLANFNPLTPTPGARLYDRLLSENRLIYKHWWIDPQYRYGQATFHPKKMSTEELTEGCFHARCKFNKYSSILKRAFAPKTNCRDLNRFGIYLASNLISRREIFKKQGILLGKNGSF
jgi:radical SAM superfamily enzyme YgiQ (UPF0313 family)